MLADSDTLVLEGSYRSADEAIDGIAQTRPDAVLMVVPLPDLDGVHCIRLLKQRSPTTRIVMVSRSFDAATVERATDAGCDAHLIEPVVPAQCLATLIRVLHTEAARPRSVGRTATPPGCVRRLSGARRCPRFSERETEFLARLCDGLSYKEIAAQLGVSMSVASKLGHRVFSELHVHTRTEALLRWQCCCSCHARTH